MEEMMDQEHKEFYQKVLGVYQNFQKQWNKQKKWRLDDGNVLIILIAFTVCMTIIINCSR